MSQTTAEELISNGEAEQDTNTALLEAVANLNQTVAALQNISSQMTDALAKLTNHSRVVSTADDLGHVKMGAGFDYDETTGTHRVSSSLTWSGPTISSSTDETTDQTTTTE